MVLKNILSFKGPDINYSDIFGDDPKNARKTIQVLISAMEKQDLLLMSQKCDPGAND